jgi:hypothetical protein
MTWSCLVSNTVARPELGLAECSYEWPVKSRIWIGRCYRDRTPRASLIAAEGREKSTVGVSAQGLAHSAQEMTAGHRVRNQLPGVKWPL